jgi:hypothetical protein
MLDYSEDIKISENKKLIHQLDDYKGEIMQTNGEIYPEFIPISFQKKIVNYSLFHLKEK